MRIIEGSVLDPAVIAAREEAARLKREQEILAIAKREGLDFHQNEAGGYSFGDPATMSNEQRAAFDRVLGVTSEIPGLALPSAAIRSLMAIEGYRQSEGPQMGGIYGDIAGFGARAQDVPGLTGDDLGETRGDFDGAGGGGRDGRGGRGGDYGGEGGGYGW